MSSHLRLMSLRPLAILAVAAVTLLGTAQFASANPTKSSQQGTAIRLVKTAPVAPMAAPSGCSSGNLCVWVNINWNDGPAQFSGSNASWFNFPHSTCQNGTWADCASSIYNNGMICNAHVYYFTDFGQPVLNIARQTGYANLTQVSTGLGDSWNDNIESNDWC